MILTWAIRPNRVGSYNPTTGVLTIAVAGDYIFSASLAADGTFSAGGMAEMYILRNGVTFQMNRINYAGNYTGQSISCTSRPIACVVGDQIKVRAVFAGSGLVWYGNTNGMCQFSAVRCAGPSQVMASEKIILDVQLSTNTAITANAAILYDQKITDSHNAYSAATGRFTAPRTDTYRVQCIARPNAVCAFTLYKNNVAFRMMQQVRTGNDAASFGINVSLLAGEYISIHGDTSLTLIGSNVFCVTSV